MSRITSVLLGGILMGLLPLSGCSVLKSNPLDNSLDRKIAFDLNRLDGDGLYGVSDGKRALSYEFCIPDTVAAAQQVMNIDPSLIIYKESPGRIGCSKHQYLAMGDTFQKNHRITLQQLADLDYVSRIIETHFE